MRAIYERTTLSPTKSFQQEYVAFRQPCPLRIADIGTLPHRDQRRHDAEQRRRAGFRLTERIAPADRTLRRRGRPSANDRRVVGSTRRDRSGEQGQCDQTADAFPITVEMQLDDISPMGGIALRVQVKLQVICVPIV